MTEVPIQIVFEPSPPKRASQTQGIAIGRWTVRGIRDFPVEGFVEEKHQVGNVPALGSPAGVEIHRREVTIMNDAGGFVDACLAGDSDCRDVRSGITYLRTESSRVTRAGIELTLVELK